MSHLSNGSSAASEQKIKSNKKYVLQNMNQQCVTSVENTTSITHPVCIFGTGKPKVFIGKDIINILGHEANFMLRAIEVVSFDQDGFHGSFE